MTIGSSQVKSLLGIKGSTNGFVESWRSVFTNIENTKLWDTVLGISTIIVLLCLKVRRIISHLNNHFEIETIGFSILKLEVARVKCLVRFVVYFYSNKNWFLFFLSFQNLKYKKSLRDVDSQSVWKNETKKYLSLGRNAIVVIFGTLLAYILNAYGEHPFSLTGKHQVPIDYQ